MRPDAAQCTSRLGEPKLLGQLPDLYRQKPDGPVTAVVNRYPEAAPAPHVVRIFHSIVWAMVVMRCGWGGVIGRYRWGGRRCGRKRHWGA